MRTLSLVLIANLTRRCHEPPRDSRRRVTWAESASGWATARCGAAMPSSNR